MCACVCLLCVCVVCARDLDVILVQLDASVVESVERRRGDLVVVAEPWRAVAAARAVAASVAMAHARASDLKGEGGADGLGSSGAAAAVKRMIGLDIIVAPCVCVLCPR